MSDGGCCSPSRGGEGTLAAPPLGTRAGVTDGMVLVPSRTFWMGSDDAFAYPDDGEGPPIEIELDAFWIDSCAVTNAEFGGFVAETGYATEAPSDSAGRSSSQGFSQTSFHRPSSEALG